MGAVPAVLAVLLAAVLVLLDVAPRQVESAPATATPSASGSPVLDSDAILFAALERGEIEADSPTQRRTTAAAVLLSLTLLAAAGLGVGLYLGLRALKN